MRESTPAAGDGISVSTLSVDTSSSGSSASTRSPSCLSHRVTVPSVTLSPSRGMVTDTGMSYDSSWIQLVRGTRKDPVTSAVRVQRLAGQREVRLAERLVLGRVRVDQLRDLRRERFPVVDQLRLADELAHPRTDHVDADDRAVVQADQL